MARRKTNFKVNKHNRVQREYSMGKGDLVYQVFQCLNPDCTHIIVMEKNTLFEEDNIKTDFNFSCPHCDYTYRPELEEIFYQYTLDSRETNPEDDGATWETIETGDFIVSHTEYLQKSKSFKYCIICSTLQPVENFSIHNSRRSKRQGECITCKNRYNSFKNGTRTQEQFAESAQKRRLYSELAGNNKIDYKAIRRKYDNNCFNCGCDLSDTNKVSNLDHTLPAMYLWPLNTNNATLLCSDCNQNKSGLWPSQFYNNRKLHELAVRTGIPYATLNGDAIYNPEAIEKLHQKEVVDSIITNYSRHLDEIIKIRNRILRDTGFDFFTSTNIISQSIIDDANSKL